jgi:hypothetical protein
MTQYIYTGIYGDPDTRGDTAVLIYCAGNTAIYREMIILRYVLLCTGRYLSDHYLSGRYLSLYMFLQKCQVLAGRLA